MSRAVRLLAKRIGPDYFRALNEGFSSATVIGGWNDAEGRTEEQVIAAMRGEAIPPSPTR